MTEYDYYSMTPGPGSDGPIWRYQAGWENGMHLRRDTVEPAVATRSHLAESEIYYQLAGHEVPAWARPEGEVNLRVSLDNTAFEEALIKAKGDSPFSLEDPRTAFEGGGVRDGAEKTERFELAWTADQSYDEQMLTRYARWMARGADKYADRNWESFASDDALEHAKGSLLRHVFKLLAGQVDEDHAAAVWFNVAAIELIRGKR